MDTLTADPPQAGAEPAAGPTAAGGASEPAGAPPPQPQASACRRCGAPLAPGQEWCLQCGTGVPGSLGSPAWRGAATIAAIAAVLVLAAAAAGYAALSKSPRKARVVTKTVAAAPAAVTPAAPTTTPPPAIKGVTPQPTAKPLKIPPITTPKALVPIAPATRGTGTATTPTTSAGSGSGSGGGEEQVSNALVLDTNAASTYNPYAYPASIFGDPSLAIDGDSSTGWTAQVQAASAPRMAEGLVVDLKTAQRIATLKLVTTTPGITVQVYGANSKALPNSITDPAWVPLSHSTIVKKRHASLALRESKHAFRFITLWISSAPASSTPRAPGRVTVNELELFPAG